jgi:hypothetical protein
MPLPSQTEMIRHLLTFACLVAGISELAPQASAAVWKSSEYYCQVTLPDGNYVHQWYAMLPGDESGVLAGARRQDYTGIVYLGVVDENGKPHFVLDEKSVDQLDKSFFGPGVGFLDKTQKITQHGVDGYRLIGRHRFNGRNYAMVVDMFFYHGLVYQVAGLSNAYDTALQDDDVRAFMNSFYILP